MTAVAYLIRALSRISPEPLLLASPKCLMPLTDKDTLCHRNTTNYPIRLHSLNLIASMLGINRIEVRREPAIRRLKLDAEQLPFDAADKDAWL